MISSLYSKIKQFTQFKIEPKNHPTAQTLLFYFICISEVVIILYFIPIAFANNDDTTMNAIASGAMTGTPSEYLLFTNIIIGHLLTFLYSATSEINWYAWYLILTFSFGYIFIQYFFFKITSGLIKNITTHIVVFAFLYPNLLELQFTKIAAIGLAGGFLHIFTSAKEKDYMNTVAGILLVLTGALIRKEVFYMYLILAVPFFLVLLINSGRKKKEVSDSEKDAPGRKPAGFHFHGPSKFLKSKNFLFHKDNNTLFGVLIQKLICRKRELSFSAIAITLAISAIAFDHYQYSNNPAFREYRHYNTLRSKITTHDNPSFTYENYKSVLHEVGWDITDFNVASNFNIDVGHPKFNNTKLSKIVENINNSSVGNTLSKLYNTIRLVIRYVVLKLHYISILLFLLTWNFIWGDKKRFLLAGYLFYITAIAALVTLVLDGSLKERIIWNFSLPLFLLSLICTLYNTKFFKIKVPGIFRTSILPVLLILISVSVIARNTGDALILHKERRLADRSVASYLSNLPIDFYVSWCNLDSYDPLDLPYDQQNRYTLGWLAGSPFNKEKIKKYTGKDNSGIYTIFDKDIVWIFRNNFFYKKANYHEKVKAFYLHNYENAKISIDTIPVNKKDTLYKYTFFIRGNPKQN
jgi:hypothetical protein